MAHTLAEKRKLLRRVRRLKTQLDAIDSAMAADTDAAGILHLVTVFRGSINSLVAEVLEDHIRVHVLASDAPAPSATRAAEELIQAVHTYVGH